MKYISPIISDARNKLGGTVYARNRSGTFQRAHVAPTQPRTPIQQANRALFATVTKMWATLTPSQILGWNTFAAGTTWTDTLGHTFNPSGSQLFVQCQMNLSTAGLSFVVDPPTGQPEFPDVNGATLFSSASGGSVSTLTIEYQGSITPGTTPIVFKATPPLSPGITFVAPFQYRVFSTPDLISGQFVEYTTVYRARFPTATAGQQIGVQFHLVDPATGLSSTVAKIFQPFTT